MTDQQLSPAARGPLAKPVQAVGGAGKDFFTGIGFLFRGLGMYARSPRLMFLGLIPAVISAVVVVAAVVAVVYFSGDLADDVTPFARGWSGGLRDTVHVLAMVAIIGAGALLAVLLYATLTLLIGEPFYEAISHRVEDKLGGVPNEVTVPMVRMLAHSLVDSLRLLLFTVLLGIPLFAAGFIPVVGQTVVPVLGAMVGGWALALELTTVPFERRGMRLAQRRQVLRGRRAMALGFGMATFVCFLIPLGAVLVMPAAVAGATMMTRRVFGLPDSPATAPPTAA